jgi:GntR family transcriptional repressor for pyruvate dehydrogenase complex
VSVNDQQFSSSVAERLERWVVENLESGSYLPAEKVLAETYGVSRLTIREAMRHLAGRGLIDTSQGRRAQVTRIQSTPLVSFLTYAAMREPTSVLDLIEVRVALEVR